jgi:hypothetical protein
VFLSCPGQREKFAEALRGESSKKARSEYSKPGQGSDDDEGSKWWRKLRNAQTIKSGS